MLLRGGIEVSAGGSERRLPRWVTRPDRVHVDAVSAGREPVHPDRQRHSARGRRRRNDAPDSAPRRVTKLGGSTRGVSRCATPGASHHDERSERNEAEAELKSDPSEPGKLVKLVEALRRSENLENENRAIEMLEEAFKRTSQFRWRKRAGEIKLHQLARMERSIVSQLRADPANEDLKQQIAEFRKTRLEEELSEYTLCVDNYPTETEF